MKDTPVESIDWKEMATRLLRVEMQRSGVGFKELSRKLAELGIEVQGPQLSNKVNRGVFSFVFFLQCMRALDTDYIRIRDEQAASSKKSVKELKEIETKLRAAIR
jgi:predicted amino acid-binding ACT domain protein